MLPMNKIISLNPSECNTKRVGVAARSSKTILNRYKEKFASHGGELSLDELYKFLSGENARILAKRHGDGSLSPQTLEDCQEFASFYISWIDRETRREMSRRFDGLPFFIQKGIKALSTQSFFPNCSSSLTDEQLKIIGSVVEYIEGLHTNCLVSFCIMNPDGDKLRKCIAFDADASTKKIQSNRQKILAYAGYLTCYGGRMILRQYLPDRKFILYGFAADSGKLQAIPAERLKEDFQNSPKCTEEDLGSMTFATLVLS